MTQSESSAKALWSAPECPFLIKYSPRALDEIRLAVMDAFFSLPRGGAEIGGILFGDWDGERVAITDHRPLDCEHAFGPSFVLSPRDEALLGDLLAAPNAKGLQPVGWYHSHTRSEIFLSDADVEIHRRYFPEPWQVALVLKPHTFHPARAGFFYRDANGAIHAERSANESVLTPLATKPAPSGETALPKAAAKPDFPPPTAAAEPEAAPRRTPLPKFLDPPPPRTGMRLRAALALMAGFALGAAGYLQRDLWLTPVLAMIRRVPAPAPQASLGLNTLDSDGQLQIRWNPASAAVRQAAGGILSIDTGGSSPQAITLDKAHLLSGAFTFARQTERVDVSLSLPQPDGGAAREVTTFMGKLPDPKPAEGAAPEQGDSLVNEVQKIQSDLDAEIERNTKLKKSVDQLGKQLRDQQRSRLRNQSRDRN